MDYFFGIKNSNLQLKGLTSGDFATVKKKVDFWGTTDIDEITKMLSEEVKVKNHLNSKTQSDFKQNPPTFHHLYCNVECGAG